LRGKYFNYYLLSFFNKERPVNNGQLIHVFHAKRTPSMFYLIEKNKWHHGFNLAKHFKRNHLEKMIQTLAQKQWLRAKDKGYLLTDSGEKAYLSFFNERYYPHDLQTFSYISVRNPFFSRLQLFVQVFSELSYKNAHYSPVIKHPHHQENVRQLFLQFEGKTERVFQQWLKEQSFLFKKLPASHADILASQLSGHDIVGETQTQLAQALNMNSIEYNFYQQSLIEELIELILNHKKKTPIINSIFKQIHKETNYGLSQSTYQSYLLLREGYTIEAIASRRGVKANTVREHILEMAFVFHDFPYRNFVPETLYKALNQGFETTKDYDYRQALEENNEMEFMHFRLVELERMRTL